MTLNAAGPDAAEGLEPPGCPLPGMCACPGGEAEMAKRLGEARNRDALLRIEISAMADKLVAAGEREKVLREALGWFLGEDARFQVGVGGNPIVVERMIAEARRRAALTHTAPSERPDERDGGTA